MIDFKEAFRIIRGKQVGDPKEAYKYLNSLSTLEFRGIGSAISKEDARARAKPVKPGARRKFRSLL